jgi:O-antigen/teichoic acid export membrane protein
LGYSATTIIIGSAVGLILPSLFAYKKTLVFFRRQHYDKFLFKKFFTYGMPLATASILDEFTQFADRFMLAGMQDKGQSAMYTVGYGLSGYSVFMIMSAINLAAYPTIIKLLEDKGREAAINHFRTYAIVLVGVSLPAVAGLILVGPNLVYLVIGKEYQQSVIMLLPWITIALFFGGIQAFYMDLAFQLAHFTKGIVKISFLVASINLILNYNLIPLYGMKGAAIATLSSYLVGMILSGIWGRKRFPVPFPVQEFLKIILAVVFMSFLLWWLKDMRGWLSLISQVLLGIGAYGSVIVLFNILDARDWVVTYLKKLKIVLKAN